MPQPQPPTLIVDKLQIPTVLLSNVPAGHVAMSFPIRIEDADMIASISDDSAIRSWRPSRTALFNSGGSWVKFARMFERMRAKGVVRVR
jgi:hypothetical protein